MDRLDPHDRRLLDEFQRDFPLVPRPFEVLAVALGLTETDVIARLVRLQAIGTVARVGGTVRPNTAGASTLAALAVPEARIETVAAIVGVEPGVNHSYLREDDWNLWFVATAPDAAGLEASLARIGAQTGLQVLDLRLLRAFNIDLGFRLTGARAALTTESRADTAALHPTDRPLLQAMAAGFPLVAKPYAALAADLGWTEVQVLNRLAQLSAARILTRIGIIVRHRAIGWAANAMVVWDVPENGMEPAGRALAALSGVTLCYQRQTVPGLWRHGLFSMIHGQSRPDALTVLDSARALPALANIDHRVLFSTRCFKQTGALLERSAA
ncbi:MAG: Lrp/AsnC family transcriptional regulator [Rhodobacteraceae bacterium CG17_big_fil_post_rev_8_21_14_2_50_63_15]|nr:MAG: Lrp/AsnC family transcriptional regulator [Rhodobacteraceae bacterium CG17_big_fil_post_rev_8_21_14_2_50_63_15]